MSTPRSQRSSKDIPYIKEENEKDQIINRLIDEFNYFTKSLSFQSNFNCQIIETTLGAGETKQIAHSLGVKPLFRIILRQEGNGVISDIPSGWTKNSIELINNGAVSVTATIMIVRE